jgi:hypothetical protein
LPSIEELEEELRKMDIGNNEEWWMVILKELFGEWG